MRRHLHRSRGFTFLELMICVSITVLVLFILLAFIDSSNEVVSENRVRIRATAQLRRNLVAVTNVLRGIDVYTLHGFDEDSSSENPRFQRVTGAELDQRSYGPVEELRWIASSQAVDGVAQPGGIYLVTPTDSALLADRVPQGGFHLRQDGNTIAVTLTTYYTIGPHRSKSVTGRTAIQMRN